MNNETLERLLIDRHLGELEPDAAALLDAYLAARPPPDSLVADLGDTLDLAAKAARASASFRDRPLPPLAAPRPRANARRRRMTWVRQALSVAAVFVAFLLGSMIGPAASDKVAIVQPGLSNPAPTTESAGGFWSVQRLRATHTPRKSRPRRLQWTAPLRQPRTGDRT